MICHFFQRYVRIKGQCTFNASRLVREVLRREVYAFSQKSRFLFYFDRYLRGSIFSKMADTAACAINFDEIF